MPRTPSATSRSASSRAPAGGRLRPRRADRARARVQRADPAAAVRDGPRGRHRGDPARPDPAAGRLRRRARRTCCPRSRPPTGSTRVRRWSGCGSTRRSFRPYPATVQRLLPVEIGELNRLYQLGFASWLPSTAIADGVYYGLRVNGQLVAAAGTHVVSPASAAGGRRQRPDPCRLSWSWLRDRRDGRGDRRTAADVRPGRAQRPLRQSARPQRLSPTRIPGARPLRGTARPSPGLAPGRPRRAVPAPASTARRSTLDDHRQHILGPRRHRPRPRRRGRPTDRMGRARDARPAPDPRALRARPAARRPAHRRVPPRHDRDRQPDAHAQGRRRAGRARGEQPALDQGRRRGRAGRRVRHRDVRPARRGQRDVLLAPSVGRRHASAADDGRRLRPREPAPHRAPGPGRRRSTPGPRRRRPASSACGRWPPTGCSASRSSRSTRPRPSTSSTTATGPARARSTASCARRTSSSPGARSSSPATAGWARGSPRGWPATARTSRSSRSTRSAPSRR